MYNRILALTLRPFLAMKTRYYEMTEGQKYFLNPLTECTKFTREMVGI